MTLYLQIDGVDDYLTAPSFPIDEIIIDLKSRANASTYLVNATSGTFNLRRSSNGTYSYSGFTVQVNGSAVTSGTNFLTQDVRAIVRLTRTSSSSSFRFFTQLTTAGFAAGDIYDIKFYNAGALQAHYDMTTGTVQDQSGNGHHATLTGGTWVDDGVGGTPTGTDGSTAFDVRPSLYSDSNVKADAKQQIYADSLFNTDMRNVLYSDSFTAFDTLQQLYESGADGSVSFDLLVRLYQDSTFQTDVKQVIYSDSATGYDTKLSFYREGLFAFDTLQEFFSDGIVGSVPFDLRVVLYADSQAIYDSKQSFYSDGASNADLAQQLYQAGVTSADTKLVVYADALAQFDAKQSLYSDAFVKADVAQRYYADGVIDLDTLQAIIDNWVQYNEVIQIVLNITRKQTAALDITQRVQSELKL